jgi:hypothetical protein
MQLHIHLVGEKQNQRPRVLRRQSPVCPSPCAPPLRGPGEIPWVVSICFDWGTALTNRNGGEDQGARRVRARRCGFCDRFAERPRSGAFLPAQVISATSEHLSAEDIAAVDLSLAGLTDPRTHRQSSLRRNVPLEGETDRLELCETVGDDHWRERRYSVVRAVYRSRTCPRGNRTPSDVPYSKTLEGPVESTRRVGR